VIANERAGGDREGSRRWWAMIKGTADSEKAPGTRECARHRHRGSEVMGARHRVSGCDAAPRELPCGSDRNRGLGAPSSEFFFFRRSSLSPPQFPALLLSLPCSPSVSLGLAHSLASPTLSRSLSSCPPWPLLPRPWAVWLSGDRRKPIFHKFVSPPSLCIGILTFFRAHPLGT
jgi:hypothetical protein